MGLWWRIGGERREWRSGRRGEDRLGREGVGVTENEGKQPLVVGQQQQQQQRNIHLAQPIKGGQGGGFPLDVPRGVTFLLELLEIVPSTPRSFIRFLNAPLRAGRGVAGGVPRGGFEPSRRLRKAGREPHTSWVASEYSSSRDQVKMAPFL